MFSGAAAFCAAVLVLTFDILSGLSGMYIAAAGSIPGVNGQAIVISVGLLLLGVPSTLYGLVLLFLRL
ncbi:hypothetical protein E6P09_00245 [Haloferax mediterranei ATCC 33500]|uniref:Uncharacterized protein n=1 Tax=Haloferax mediterranei (strain ATCC 33500 / DSM 1411 / JCM 8866 / NBRC 14739 / NCIMB 2177 / R-4) TaxID=523841 RepID=A0A4P8P779_HALMT|nr:hypothetical protein E6P09_00245 [Haloferax mediterranei ATCC 33500]